MGLKAARCIVDIQGRSKSSIDYELDVIGYECVWIFSWDIEYWSCLSSHHVILFLCSSNYQGTIVKPCKTNTMRYWYAWFNEIPLQTATKKSLLCLFGQLCVNLLRFRYLRGPTAWRDSIINYGHISFFHRSTIVYDVFPKRFPKWMLYFMEIPLKTDDDFQGYTPCFRQPPYSLIFPLSKSCCSFWL